MLTRGVLRPVTFHRYGPGHAAAPAAALEQTPLALPEAEGVLLDLCSDSLSDAVIPSPLTDWLLDSVSCVGPAPCGMPT